MKHPRRTVLIEPIEREAPVTDARVRHRTPSVAPSYLETILFDLV
jgi:hypothetical protein